MSTVRIRLDAGHTPVVSSSGPRTVALLAALLGCAHPGETTDSPPAAGDQPDSGETGGPPPKDSADDSGDAQGSGDTGASGEAGGADTRMWYRDADGDGHGAPGTGVEGVGGEGWVTTDHDCDDTDANRYPSAPELCDGYNNGCRDTWSGDAEDGQVSYFDAGGRGADRTAEWVGTPDSPARPTLDAGTWRACAGTFYVSATTAGPLVLRGVGQGVTTLSGGDRAPILSSGAALAVEGLTMSDGVGPYGGAIEHTAGDLVVRDTTFTANTGALFGGALYAFTTDGSGVILQGVTFSTNVGGYGGGAYLEVAGDVRVDASVFDENTAAAAGGLWVDAESLTISTSTFQENAADGSGGGLWVEPGRISAVTLEDSLFEDNYAGVSGGGASVNTTAARGTVTVRGTVFQYNSNDLDGAGAYLAAASLDISDTVVMGNTGEGGGLVISGGAVGIRDSRFVDNGRGQSGGGLRLYVADTATLERLVFSGNEANGGGAIFMNGPSALALATISGSIFEDNVGGNGGAVRTRDLTVAVDSTSFTGNTGGYGGAFYTYGPLILDPGTVFEQNTANVYGGALYVQESTSCRGEAAMPSSFFANDAYRGAAVYIMVNSVSTFTSTDCDFGVGAEDNPAYEGDDLYLYRVGEYTYGNAATFTCTDTECS